MTDKLTIQRCDRCSACEVNSAVWEDFQGWLRKMGWVAEMYREPACRGWGIIASDVDGERCVPVLLQDRHVIELGAEAATKLVCDRILASIEAKQWDAFLPEGTSVNWRRIEAPE